MSNEMETDDIESVCDKMELEDIEPGCIFPDEVLLSIFGHLNDTALLNMTRVCKRFQRIAKEAFGKKYNGDTDDDDDTD